MITTTTEIVSAAEILPIEMRLEIIDRLLEGIGPSKEEIDKFWLSEAERRSEEIKSGLVKTVPGVDVLNKVRERYGL